MLYDAANERAEQELQFALLKSKNGQKFFENGPNYCREGKIESAKKYSKIYPQNRSKIGQFL